MGYCGLGDVPVINDIGNIDPELVPPALSTPPYINPEEKTSGKKIVNWDASLIINEGPAISGGAHSDIFKDEVIYLIWALTAGASINI